jgi:uncharacterized protein (TIGR03790 family)
MAFCIAEWRTAYRKFTGARLQLSFGVLMAAASPISIAQLAPNAASPVVQAAAAAKPTPGLAIPRLAGRLHAGDVGVVINTADPASVQVGEYYALARKLTPEQVLRVSVPNKAALTREEFERLRQSVEAGFGREIQALALAWTEPYAVECNSITGALALGFDAELCKNGCSPSRPSRYFNSPSIKPLADLGWRPSMLLAARNFDQAKGLIDRGVAADASLAYRGRPPVSVMLLATDDAPRRVRMALYPPAGQIAGLGVEIRHAPAADLGEAKRVLMVTTGSVRVALNPAPDWVPGAFGDHLTSTGGDLFGTHGQSTALAWLDSGATASHGAVSEPCNHLQKFPHPQVVLGHYLQGSTLIEAYWKSVAWPQQSLFVGEPLAAPFARH